MLIISHKGISYKRKYLLFINRNEIVAFILFIYYGVYLTLYKPVLVHLTNCLCLTCLQVDYQNLVKNVITRPDSGVAGGRVKGGDRV